MSKRLTADELCEIMRRSPGNLKANEAAMQRSGRQVTMFSALDVERLATLLNERFAK